MVRLLRAVAALLVLLPSAWSWGATGRPVLYINQLDPSKPPTIRVYVTDLDSSLSPITDRKPLNYRLLVDGAPQTGADRVLRFHQLGEPVALMLVIQVSSSLRDTLSEAVDATKKLIDSLPAKSKVGLVAYADVVVQQFKPNAPSAAKEAVDGLRVQDAAEVNLPDAIKDALEGFDGGTLPKQRYMVVISDGLTADLNVTTFAELGRRAQDKGVTVHCVGYAPLEPARLRTLHELSKPARGITREVKDAGGVTRALSAVQEQIKNQLVLTYDVGKFFDGKLHDFQIETQNDQASNIVPVELPKYIVAAADKPSVFRSTGFLIGMIVVAQAGLVLIVIVALRWRSRNAAAAAAARAQQRQRRYDEDEEETEEEAEEEDDEKAKGRGERNRGRGRDDEEDEEEEDEEDKQEEKRPARGREERKSAARPSRAMESLKESFKNEPAADDSDEDWKGGAKGGAVRGGAAAKGAAGPKGRNFESLLTPDPSLLESKPDHGDPLLDTDLSHPPAPRAQAPRTPLPTPGGPVQSLTQPTAADGAPFRLPLPDPEQFIKQGQAAAAHDPDIPTMVSPEAASASSGSVRRSSQMQVPTPSDKMAAAALPDPEEFMRRIAANQSSSRVKASPEAYEDLALPPRGGGSTGKPSVAGGIPLSPGLVPVAMPPEAGVQPGRFLDRKTKVMAVEDLSNVDYVAWIVQVSGGAYRTATVRDGFTIGSDPEMVDLQVQGQGIRPQHGTIKVDAEGARLETTGERSEQKLSQPLRDGDHFFIGDCEFGFKVAMRSQAMPFAAVRLEVLDGMDTGRKIPLPESQVVTIGGHSNCDLIVRGEGVERFHAIAMRKDRQCIISDLGSQTGLGFQGQRVGFKKLNSWEEVTLGQIRVVFTYEEWDAGDNAGYEDEHLQTWDNIQTTPKR